jgi:hypothetical protein
MESHAKGLLSTELHSAQPDGVPLHKSTRRLEASDGIRQEDRARFPSDREMTHAAVR